MFIIKGDFVNGCDYGRHCTSLKSKIYQLKITFGDKESHYAIFDFQANYKVAEYMNVAHGGTEAELEINLTFNTHIGNYACYGRKYVKVSFVD
ncbi:unnamed protein product [Adineta steineri]|uniref:Uncharacterized protein n=1 Tax=Adineta steineri TaxID=433720 RepID=A0A813V999_9BILA|nr:unnamed protein product [Adineta steineri]CAF1124377.1 unnamed protein product [Adineta steineri]